MSNTKHLFRLKLFLWVEKEGSIKAAACKHGLSQPSVSQQMQALEEELGVKLRARTRNQATLTKAGKHFAEGVRKILADYERLCGQVKNLDAKSARKLRVGFSPSPTEDFRATAFERFERANPGMLVVPNEVQTKPSMKQLLRNQLDVTLVVEPLSVPDGSLCFEKLTEREVYCVVAKEHPFAARSFVTKEDMRAETILGFSRVELSQYHEYFVRWFAPVVPDLVDDYTDAKNLLGAVAKKAGITVLFTSAGLLHPGVRLVPIRPAFPPVAIGAMYVRPASATAISATVESFIELVKTVIAELPSEGTSPPR